MIYKAEKDIAHLLKNNKSVSYLAKLEKCDAFPIKTPERVFASIAPNIETPNTKDLYYTKSLFVSTVWNENDDVFDPAECWAARKTPVDKPTNLEHDQNIIVGHITSQWAVDGNGDIIDDEAYPDDLPQTYHICNGAVIYLAWSDKDKAELIQNLIAGIENGDYFVSMECLFSQFDYAMSNKLTNETEIVTRNKDTAFLTKHLRAYGGTGEYENYKVGRLLRNMIFSGKAYTKTPANPDSIIFNSDNCKIFDFACAKLENVFLTKNCVDKNMENNVMSDNANRNFEAELAEAKANEKVAVANIEKLTAEIETLKNQNAELNSAIAEKNEALEVAKACDCENCKKMEEMQKINEALAKQVAELQLQTAASIRLNKLMEVGVEKAQAKEIVIKFANLNDEQFDAIASVYKAQVTKNTDTQLLDQATVDHNASASVGAVDFNKDDQDFEALQKAVSSILENVQE